MLIKIVPGCTYPYVGKKVQCVCTYGYSGNIPYIGEVFTITKVFCKNYIYYLEIHNEKSNMKFTIERTTLAENFFHGEIIRPPKSRYQIHSWITFLY